MLPRTDTKLHARLPALNASLPSSLVRAAAVLSASFCSLWSVPASSGFSSSALCSAAWPPHLHVSPYHAVRSPKPQASAAFLRLGVYGMHTASAHFKLP